MSDAAETERLLAVTLDERSIGRASPDIEHERAVALYDLLEANRFNVPAFPGPYRAVISLVDNRLAFQVRSEADGAETAFVLSLTPFRTVVRDYFVICESYHQAIRSGSPSRIEAIDMGRRALHNEGSQILIDRLKGKIEIDFDTARRLFTLICVLHWRG